MPRGIYRVIWIISSIAILAMTVLFAGQPYVAPPSGTMKTFTIKDNSFSIKHPENWKSNGLALHDIVAEVLYQPSPNIYFHITSDLQGSLISGMLPTEAGMDANPNTASGADANLNSADAAALDRMIKQMPGADKLNSELKKTPLERLHEAQLAQMEKRQEKFPSFKDGETRKTNMSGVEGLVTNFTLESDNGLLGKKKLHGKRITLLTSDRQVSIVCYCLNELQKEIDPIFDTMLKSLDLHPKGV